MLGWRDKSGHWGLSSVGPACSGLHEKVELGERVAGESQVPDVEQMPQADLGCLSEDLTTVWISCRAQATGPVPGLEKEYLRTCFSVKGLRDLGEQMYSLSQAVQVDFMMHLGRR